LKKEVLVSGFCDEDAEDGKMISATAVDVGKAELRLRGGQLKVLATAVA
jgi:hypothetical protein